MSKQIHRALKFKCEHIFAKYISANTYERAHCGDDVPKRDFFKLMNNATYGKTIQNVTKQMDFHLETDLRKALKLADQPNCVRWKIFEDDKLIGIEMRKKNVVINKPFHVRL